VRAHRGNDRIELHLGDYPPRPAVSIDGGRGDDHLYGSYGDQVLIGRSGDDVLRGGAGRDWEFGGEGDDALDGGSRTPGSTEGADGYRDHLTCGTGRDRVDDPGSDPIRRSCERVGSGVATLDYGSILAHPQPDGPRRVRVETVCDGYARRCAHRALLRYRGVEIGRGPVVEMRSGHHRLPVDLDRELPTSGVIRIVVDGENRDEDGASRYRFTWRVRAGPAVSSR
jgi:hypothetical protein